MKRAREQARELRRQGMSVRDITKITGASKSSVSLWVRDIGLTEEQKQRLKDNQRYWAAQSAGAQVNRDRARARRLAYQEEGRARARENRPLHLIGCMLFWAEGAKDRNRVYFVNSDPNMMKLFMRFLREEMGVDDASISMYVHSHASDPDERKRIAEYWLELLNLPMSSLRKIFVKKGSNTRHNVLRNGVCSIRVHSSQITQHIYGAIQEYGGFDNPEWLF